MMIVIGNVVKLKAGSPDPGLTTEVAILLMFAVGAYIVIGFEEVAIAIGGGVAVLLHFKGQLHGLTKRLGADDLKAIMQFVLISLVILPVLPDRTFGPYDVLNPRSIWWMVVLIVAISLVGYIAYKFTGGKAGAAFGGILGGAVSSTATTVSYARRTSSSPEASDSAAIAIMMASTVTFPRVLLLVALISPAFFGKAGLPLLVMLLIFIALSAGTLYWGHRDKDEMPPQHNPTELKPALLFGLIYGIVILAVAAANETFGDSGLYGVAGLSGLTSVDAITLSTSQLVHSGRVIAEDGWRVLLIAILANLVFKSAIIAVLGHRRLLWKIGSLYAIALVGGVLLLLLWP
jgi:uncharacterized membrane protein (DUF4010 family)